MINGTYLSYNISFVEYIAIFSMIYIQEKQTIYLSFLKINLTYSIYVSIFNYIDFTQYTSAFFTYYLKLFKYYLNCYITVCKTNILLKNNKKWQIYSKPMLIKTWYLGT